MKNEKKWNISMEKVSLMWRNGKYNEMILEYLWIKHVIVKSIWRRRRRRNKSHERNIMKKIMKKMKKKIIWNMKCEEEEDNVEEIMKKKRRYQYQ